MADQTASSPDPFAMWREWVGQSERQWNAFLNQTMASDQYGQSLGRFMELHVTLQKGMNEAMGRTLTALNLPSRTDILALGDRLAAIEDRLATIETRLEQVTGAEPSDGSAGAVARPPRTKRPATA